jgi:hypothetical protein
LTRFSLLGRLAVTQRGTNVPITAGKQRAVLAAGHGGHALIDRELYLPDSRAADLGRRAAAGVTEDTAFATKPALALYMISAALMIQRCRACHLMHWSTWRRRHQYTAQACR